MELVLHLVAAMENRFPLEEFMLPDRIERLREVAESRTRSLTVVLDGVHDPHNLSAVVRSAEAFGLLDLYVIESHAEFCIVDRITQGAEKWIDIHCYAEPEPCIEALAARDMQLWLADPTPGSRQVADLPYQEKIALIFGNEHEGPGAQMRAAARGKFHIPMLGFTQSLNISVSAGICLAAAVTARQSQPGGHGDLPPAELDQLVSDWQQRSVRAADKILARIQGNAKVSGRDGD